jgi:Mg-chelatase subunit ChlD
MQIFIFPFPFCIRILFSSGDVGRCVIVLISDGRANVPLEVSLGEAPEVAEGTEKKKLTDAEKKEQRTKLKDEVRLR